MSAQGTLRAQRWRWILPAALVAVLGWLALRPSVRVPEPVSAVTIAPSAEPAALAATRDAVGEVAGDGVPVLPAGSASVPPGPHHPHPITPRHERIFRENALIGSLNGAVDVKDVAGIRRLLAHYREEYPEDEHALQNGYAAIADCIEQPGSAARAAGKRYYDEELASNIRRYVRRHCLE